MLADKYQSSEHRKYQIVHLHWINMSQSSTSENYLFCHFFNFLLFIHRYLFIGSF
jgi:hypothetical protein